MRAQDPEAAGWCHNCGDIYAPAFTQAAAQMALYLEKYPSGHRSRARNAMVPGSSNRVGKPNEHGIVGDGCDEAPSCLDCPLAECKYVAGAEPAA